VNPGCRTAARNTSSPGFLSERTTARMVAFSAAADLRQPCRSGALGRGSGNLRGSRNTPATGFIERLSEPGDLVVDPFCGFGTMAPVCRRMSRRCLTSDVDGNAVAIACERVATEARRQR
jgi:DNA methylase